LFLLSVLLLDRYFTYSNSPNTQKSQQNDVGYHFEEEIKTHPMDISQPVNDSPKTQNDVGCHFKEEIKTHLMDISQPVNDSSKTQISTAQMGQGDMVHEK
jgi:hypothetical protein